MRAMRFALPLSFRTPTAEEESAIRSWSWNDVPMEHTVVGLHDHDDFVALDTTGEVIGYCSFGPHAMVPGRFNDPDYADVAWGIRPDLVGGGNGATFIEAIIRHGASLYPGRCIRAQIRLTNPRSLRAAIRAGFEEHERVAKRVIVVQPKEGDRADVELRSAPDLS
jgi:RimJ/RimL family protein N-acetyltransferase